MSERVEITRALCALITPVLCPPIEKDCSVDDGGCSISAGDPTVAATEVRCYPRKTTFEIGTNSCSVGIEGTSQYSVRVVFPCDVCIDPLVAALNGVVTVEDSDLLGLLDSVTFDPPAVADSGMVLTFLFTFSKDL